MHIRQKIRNNLKTLLTGLTDTADRVYMNRVYPLDKQNGILIFTNSEDTQYLTMGNPRSQERTYSVKIEIFVKGITNYDGKIDDISVEIEEAIANNRTLSGIASDTMITGFSSEFGAEGDVPVGVGTLTLMVKYLTTENSIEV